MEHTLYQIRVKFLILFVDDLVNPLYVERVKILLDNEQVPSIMVTREFSSMNAVFLNFCDKYLNCSGDFVKPKLLDSEISKDELIVTYYAVMPYIRKLNKSGTIYSVPEIIERKISLNDKEWGTIKRSGQSGV